MVLWDKNKSYPSFWGRKNLIRTLSELFKWKPVLIGACVSFFVLIFSFVLGPLAIFISPLIGGIVSGYLVGGQVKKRAINGGIASLIPFMFFVIIYVMSTNNVGTSVVIGLIILIIVVILGIIGGIIGIYIKKRNENDFKIKTNGIICPNCKADNIIGAQFCQDCGSALSDLKQTSSKKTTYLKKDQEKEESVINSTSKVIKKRGQKIRSYRNPKKHSKLKVGFIILILIVVAGTLVATSTNSNKQVTQPAVTTAPVTTTAPANTNTNTSSSNSGEDYDRGYDSGYQDGVNDAYSNWEFYNEPSKKLKVSESWRQGYRDGYSQGYNDIKNGLSLKKPKLSWDAFFDPRTGETIK